VSVPGEGPLRVAFFSEGANNSAMRASIYEIWSGSRDRWLRDEPPKPYRETYEKGLAGLLADRAVQWMTPAAKWGGALTPHRKS
jgi:hypothetical protein